MHAPFLGSLRVPLAQIGPHNYAEYADTGRPLLYLFLNSSCCAAANRQVRVRVRVS